MNVFKRWTKFLKQYNRIKSILKFVQVQFSGLYLIYLKKKILVIDYNVGSIYFIFTVYLRGKDIFYQYEITFHFTTTYRMLFL